MFVKRQGQKYILAEGEDLPVHKVQHKVHIKKVMLLAAVGRPRRDTLHNRNFSAKIGIFPFTRQVPALRNSRHRAAGTMLTQMLEVNKEVYEEKMLSDVFPSIKAMWPDPPGRVFVQQDNAPAHNIGDDPDIVAPGTADGWDIRFLHQPANSPTPTPWTWASSLDPVPPRQDYAQHGRRAHRRGEESVRRAGL